DSGSEEDALRLEPADLPPPDMVHDVEAETDLGRRLRQDEQRHADQKPRGPAEADQSERKNADAEERGKRSASRDPPHRPGYAQATDDAKDAGAEIEEADHLRIAQQLQREEGQHRDQKRPVERREREENRE